LTSALCRSLGFWSLFLMAILLHSLPIGFVIFCLSRNSICGILESHS
jgi:hypothetical protein